MDLPLDLIVAVLVLFRVFLFFVRLIEILPTLQYIVSLRMLSFSQDGASHQTQMSREV